MGSRSIMSAACERDWWDYFNGSGRRHAKRRGKWRRKFKKYYKGARHLIPDMLATAGAYIASNGKIHPKSKASGLNEVHPEAMTFLRKWGKHFKPYRWHKSPTAEPVPKGCFLNAIGLCHVDSADWHNKKKLGRREPGRRLVYAEGIAYGPLVYPMLHGWNTAGINGRTALDWTFYSTNQWINYFGVTLTFDEHQRICRIQRVRIRERLRLRPHFFVTSLFHRKNFSIRTKVELARILQARKRAGKKLPIKKAATSR